MVSDCNKPFGERPPDRGESHMDQDSERGRERRYPEAAFHRPRDRPEDPGSEGRCSDPVEPQTQFRLIKENGNTSKKENSIDQTSSITSAHSIGDNSSTSQTERSKPHYTLDALRVKLYAGENTDPQAATAEQKLRKEFDKSFDTVVIRQDDDFTSQYNARGIRKSYLNESGDLIPANPDGQITVIQHVFGGRNAAAKGDSQFSSFQTPRPNGFAKNYGAYTIQLDLNKLKSDLDSGLNQEIQIVSHDSLTAAIQSTIEEITGRKVQLPEFEGDPSPNDILNISRAFELSKTKERQATARVQAFYNARRDNELLVGGKVPRRYLSEPYPTPAL